MANLPLLQWLPLNSTTFLSLSLDRLYFATLSDVNLKSFVKKSSSTVHYLFVDNDFVYQPYVLHLTSAHWRLCELL